MSIRIFNINRSFHVRISTVGAEVPMNDKHRSEGLEGDLPTRTSIKTSVSLIVLFPEGIRLLLILLLACLSSYGCSKISAEEQTVMTTGTYRAGQTVQDTGIAKPREEKPIRKNPRAGRNILCGSVISFLCV